MDRYYVDAALFIALPVVGAVHPKTEARREHPEHAVSHARLRQTQSVQLLRRLRLPGPVHLSDLPVLSAECCHLISPEADFEGRRGFNGWNY